MLYVGIFNAVPRNIDHCDLQRVYYTNDLQTKLSILRPWCGFKMFAFWLKINNFLGIRISHSCVSVGALYICLYLDAYRGTGFILLGIMQNHALYMR